MDWRSPRTQLLFSLIVNAFLLIFWLVSEHALSINKQRVNELETSLHQAQEQGALLELKNAQMREDFAEQQGNLSFTGEAVAVLQSNLSDLRRQYEQLNRDYEKSVVALQDTRSERLALTRKMQLVEQRAQQLVADTNEWLLSSGLPTPKLDLNASFPVLSGLSEQLSNGTIRVQIPVDLWFSEGARLNSRATSELELLANYLSQFAGFVSVEAHSDSSPVTSLLKEQYQDNLALSLARAATIKRELEQSGLAAQAVRAVGYGSDIPLRLEQSRDDALLNRRIELIVYPSLQPEK